MPDFTVSLVTPNHQTAVGKGIWHWEQVTSARGHRKWGPLKHQPWPLFSRDRKSECKEEYNPGGDLLPWLPNLSSDLSGKLERKPTPPTHTPSPANARGMRMRKRVL